MSEQRVAEPAVDWSSRSSFSRGGAYERFKRRMDEATTVDELEAIAAELEDERFKSDGCIGGEVVSILKIAIRRKIKRLKEVN